MASSLRGKRVFVGLSGGVDSGVSAALLKQSGALVTGVFIKGWYPPGMPCSWAADRRDAMRVAARLQIPFVTLDASEEYRTGVIEYLLREYKEGRTPNPDVMCNREVKFGAFYAYAKQEGADYIATGHYAQTIDGRLLRGTDPAKDQSYFLWAVPGTVLRDTLFPVGSMPKDEVRRLAKRFDLPNAEKRDSQGICFLGNVSVEDFLKAEFGVQVGRAIDEDGNLVGAHDGAVLHTLGERVALHDAPPGPWYVVRKDMHENTLTVSKERARGGTASGIRLTSMNWFTEAPTGVVQAQYRYHGPGISGTFARDTFSPSEPLPEPVASGQSLVLYDQERVLGGGIIA